VQISQKSYFSADAVLDHHIARSMSGYWHNYFIRSSVRLSGAVHCG